MLSYYSTQQNISFILDRYVPCLGRLLIRLTAALKHKQGSFMIYSYNKINLKNNNLIYQTNKQKGTKYKIII